MKRVIFKILLSVLVSGATWWAFFLGAWALQSIIGRLDRSDEGPLGTLPLTIGVFPLCCCGVGACLAWAWKRGWGFRGRWGLLLAAASFVAVGTVSGILFESIPFLAHRLTVTQHVAFHVSVSLFSSQVAFWGFSGVMRIGWKRRHVGS